MKINLEQLSIKYARAYKDLRLAERVLQGRINEMHSEPDRDGCTARKFEEISDPDGEYRRWVYAGTLVDVTDPEDLAIIARWQEAHAAKVAASKKLGSLRGSFLRAGQRLDLESKS